MASAVFSRDFWELSPYCFCQDRHWLTVDGISVVTIPVDGESTNEPAPVAGLDRDDTAIMAALLTALALFLFLLFLLLCCLFPWGLCYALKGKCCCGGSGGGCCGGSGGGCCGAGGASKRRKRKEALISASNSSVGSITLTAQDMKIPRPSMDTNDRFSDSELEKSRRFHEKSGIEDTNVDSTDCRLRPSEIYQKDSDFQDGGWFTSSDVESVYGDGGRGSLHRGTHRSMDEIDAVDGGRSQRHHDSLYDKSRSMDNLDSLMTYSQHQMDESNSYNRQASYFENARNGDVVIDRYHGNSDAGSITEELKLTRTKTLNLPTTNQNREGNSSLNAVSEITHTAPRMISVNFPSLTSPSPYMESTNQMLVSNGVTSRDDMDFVDSSTTPLPRPRDQDFVSEYRAYKRVVRETTTTTTE